MIHKNVGNKSSVIFKENADIEEALDEAGNGRYNFFVLVSCYILFIGATIDLTGFSVIVPAASCDLNLSLTESGQLMSISMAGFLTALPWGYAADTRGRKLTMLVSGTVGCVASAISSFSANFYMMLVLKFIASSFSTASLTLTTVFLGENTCLKYRTKYMFILNMAQFTANFICFVMAFLILPLDFVVPIPVLINYKPWRLLTLVLNFPLAIGTIMMCFVHESPKFLVNMGNPEKAVANLKKICKINNRIHKLYSIKSIKQSERVIEHDSYLESVVNQIVPIFQLPLLWRTLQLLLLFSICVSTINVFYTWLPAMTNSYFTSANENINFCQKIVANIIPIISNNTCVENTSIDTFYSGMILTSILFLINIITVAFANWRRCLIIGACLITGTCCIIMDMIHHPIASIVLFFTIQILGITFGSIQSYFVDIYPTQYRLLLVLKPRQILWPYIRMALTYIKYLSKPAVAGLATSLGMMVAGIASLGGVSLIGAVIIENCRLTFYCWAIYIFCGIILTIYLPETVKPRETSVQDTEH